MGTEGKMGPRTKKYEDVTDIVEQLAEWPASTDGRDMLDAGAIAGLMREAASEIERLRKDNQAHCSSLMSTQIWMDAEEEIRALRSALAAEREECAKVAEEWMTAGQLRLHMGELTAQEIRTAQALQTRIAAAIRARN